MRVTLTRPEDRVIRSTGKYNYEQFASEMGGAPNVIAL